MQEVSTESETTAKADGGGNLWTYNRLKLFGGEIGWAIIGFACLIGVPIAIAPKDAFFFGNALIYFGSQAWIIFFAFASRSRPAVIGGIAVGASLYLAAFSAWATAVRADGIIWVLYMWSLPGAILAAVAIAIWFKDKPLMAPFIAFGISVAAVIVGFGIDLAIVWGTS